MTRLRGRCLVPGVVSAPVVFSDVSLSIFGGLDPETGEIVDHHHPLCGQSCARRVLAIPSGRGSCTGSTVLLEALLNDHGTAPAAIVFQEVEEIITLGVLVARLLFARSIPVLVLSPADFGVLRHAAGLAIHDSTAIVLGHDGPLCVPDNQQQCLSCPKELKEKLKDEGGGKESSAAACIQLSDYDQSCLAGHKGEAARIAMQLLTCFADLQGTDQLLDVSRAHIDACIFTGPAVLRFARALLNKGGRVAVPTTLNSISIDRRRWREMAVDPEFVGQADALANAYLEMGATPSFTCAPYLLGDEPQFQENIGWSESNAVVFANSVLGARTQKYPDFVDVCIALTGRAPFAGCHINSGRVPSLIIHVPAMYRVDDSFYPLLGHHVGELAGQKVPLIYGIEHLFPSCSAISHLKAFSAAFATTSGAAMFHIQGVTPEAKTDESRATLFLTASEAALLPHIYISREGLIDSWYELNTARDVSVGLVSLGNPHFSLGEFEQLARLIMPFNGHPKVMKKSTVDVAITTSRDTYARAYRAGYITTLEEFGASIITDTCWCMIGESSVIKPEVQNIMTNSAKYAHYGPGLVKRGIHFGSLAQCVEAARTGVFDKNTSCKYL